jgi:hypothetical protein
MRARVGQIAPGVEGARPSAAGAPSMGAAAAPPGSARDGAGGER